MNKTFNVRLESCDIKLYNNKFKKNDLIIDKNKKKLKLFKKKNNFVKQNSEQPIKPLKLKKYQKMNFNIITTKVLNKNLEKCEKIFKNYNKDKNQNIDINLKLYESNYHNKLYNNTPILKKNNKYIKFKISKSKKSFYFFKKQENTIHDLIKRENNLKKVWIPKYKSYINISQIKKLDLKIESPTLKLIIKKTKTGDIQYFRDNTNFIKPYINQIDFYGRSCIFYIMKKSNLKLFNYWNSTFNIDFSIIDIKNKSILDHALIANNYLVILRLLYCYYFFKFDKKFIKEYKIGKILEKYKILTSLKKYDLLRNYIDKKKLFLK